MFEILKEKKASANYISAIIGAYILIIVICIFLYFMPIFKKQQALDTFARELVRCCEVAGNVSQENNILRLYELTNLSPNINFDYDSYMGTTKVQLNHNITVKLTDTYDFNFGKFFHYSFNLRSVAYGKSEVYYKE